MLATIINVILILLGSAAGLLFKNLISERLMSILTLSLIHIWRRRIRSCSSCLRLLPKPWPRFLPPRFWNFCLPVCIRLALSGARSSSRWSYFSRLGPPPLRVSTTFFSGVRLAGAAGLAWSFSFWPWGAGAGLFSFWAGALPSFRSDCLGCFPLGAGADSLAFAGSWYTSA